MVLRLGSAHNAVSTEFGLAQVDHFETWLRATRERRGGPRLLRPVCKRRIDLPPLLSRRARLVCLLSQAFRPPPGRPPLTTSLARGLSSFYEVKLATWNKSGSSSEQATTASMSLVVRLSIRAMLWHFKRRAAPRPTSISSGCVSGGFFATCAYHRMLPAAPLCRSRAPSWPRRSRTWLSPH